MSNNFTKKFIEQAKEIFDEDIISLHRPIFEGREKEYLLQCIDSNFVSSVGKKIIEFENCIANFTNSKFAIATVNGTSALHIAISLAGVKQNDEVITQSLSFIAISNAIKYTGADPIYIDVDLDTLGLSPKSLLKFLENNCEKKPNGTFNKFSGKRISACIPMHTFGFPCRVKEISRICKNWKIPLIEDCAESLGSYVDKSHTGSFSLISTLSFNGNKIITTGGGGMILTNNSKIAKKARHITTTAKVPHSLELKHNEIGFNYRMPNINASLGVAQIEKINEILKIKSEISKKWKDFFSSYNIKFFTPLKNDKANYWLNTLIFNSKRERDDFLIYTNKKGIQTRPAWTLISKLPMYKKNYNDGLKNSLWLEKRIANIPSSVPIGHLKKNL